MWQVAVGAGIQALSGLVGVLVSRGQQDEADELLRQAEANYDNLTPAVLNDIAVKILGPTELAKIKTDPRYRQAQDQSLAALGEMADNGGFDVRDQSNLARIRNDTSRQASQQNAAITESLARRGVGGSGAELALRAQANQAATERESQAGLDVAAQARQRYFDSIRARGDMATQLRGQDYNEQSAAARAQDAINQFNITNGQNMAMYNNSLGQQRYNNALGIADRKANFGRERAGIKRGQADRTGQIIAGVGNAVGGAFSSWGAQGMGGGQAPAYGDIEPPAKLDEETDDEKYRNAYGGL